MGTNNKGDHMTPSEIFNLYDSRPESVAMYTTDRGSEWGKTDGIGQVAEMTPDEIRFHPSLATESRLKWVTTHDEMEPSFEIVEACAESSIGFGLNPEHVDWDRFYETLESFGWDMQDLGGTADNRIRRAVRKAMNDGDIQL